MSASIRTHLLLMLALTFGASIHFARAPVQAAERKVGQFPALAVVQSVLQRGISREAVRNALGEPVGSGHARIPPSHLPLEIWYYEDIEIEDAAPIGGYVHLDLRQRILLVFFDGDNVEGFMWTSNTGEGEAKTK
jgi:hypothetical protein